MWATLIFILNGVVFILIGLQMPLVMKDLDGYSLFLQVTFGISISLLVMFVRMLWMFPGAYLPRMLSKRIRDTESRPSWKAVVLSGWSGMRGVVSLASALALPLTTTGGDPFPFRNTILFITFCVILMTLVLQGLTLPVLIKLLSINDSDDPAEEEKKLRIYFVLM